MESVFNSLGDLSAKEWAHGIFWAFFILIGTAVVSHIAVKALRHFLQKYRALYESDEWIGSLRPKMS